METSVSIIVQTSLDLLSKVQIWKVFPNVNSQSKSTMKNDADLRINTIDAHSYQQVRKYFLNKYQNDEIKRELGEYILGEIKKSSLEAYF